MSRVPRDEPDKKASKRKVYISHSDAVSLFNLLPKWFRPMVQNIYCTGIRVREALGLKRGMVDTDRRMIFVRPGMANEDVWERIPIRRESLPVLESCLTATTRSEDRLFVIRNRQGVRPPSNQSVKNSWRKACFEVNFCASPRPGDLRHTWKRNAGRSGLPDWIANERMGHWTVNRRYGLFAEDKELLQAIDRLTFGHGSSYLG